MLFAEGRGGGNETATGRQKEKGLLDRLPDVLENTCPPLCIHSMKCVFAFKETGTSI